MIDQHDLRDKMLLAAWRELRELGRHYWVWVELKEPVQRGWTRYYVVADKIGAHRDKKMLQDILEVIGTRSWSRTSDFRRWRRRRRKQPKLVEMEQPLAVISASRWECRQFPEIWKRYFRVELVRHKRMWHPTFVFAHPGLFELKVEPLLVTRLRVPNPEVEKRSDEIERWLRHRNLEPRLDWLRGIRRGVWKHDPRRRLISRLHLQEMRHALQNYPEADPVSVLHRYRISLWSIYSPV